MKLYDLKGMIELNKYKQEKLLGGGGVDPQPGEPPPSV